MNNPIVLSVSAIDCSIFAKKGTMEILNESLPIETPYKAYIYCKPFPDFSGLSTPAYSIDDKGEKISILSIGDCSKDEFANKTLVCGTIIGECTCYEAKRDDFGNGKMLVDAKFSGLCLYNENFKKLDTFFHACNKPVGTDCSVCKELSDDVCKPLSENSFKNKWCYVEPPVKDIFIENYNNPLMTTEDAITILNILAENPLSENRTVDKRNAQRALILAIQALSKDIAQKVDFELTPSGESCEFYCPNCLENLTSYSEFSKCPECGQSLDLQPVHDFWNSKK